MEQIQNEQIQTNAEKVVAADIATSLKGKVAELEKEKKTLRYEMDKDRTLNDEKFKFLTEQKLKATSEQQRDARKFQEDLDKQLQIRSQLKRDHKKCSDDNIQLLTQKQQLQKSLEDTKNLSQETLLKNSTLTDKAQETAIEL